MSTYVAQSDRLIITLLKHAIVIIVILITFIHITDTNYKDRKSCYKKCRVHWCSDNIGNKNCTRVGV